MDRWAAGAAAPPLASCRLSRQDEATRTCAIHLHQARCDELASPSLRVDQHADRLRQIGGRHGLSGAV